VTSPVTYGDLMDHARRSAHRGMNALAHAPLADSPAAAATLAARARLLAGLGQHATALIGAPRLEAWRAGTPHRHSPDHGSATVRAVLAWITALESSHTSTPPLTSTLAGSAAGHWARAAALVERASDLVATHHTPTGVTRPGTPVALAHGDVGPLLASTTRLVAVIAPTEPLALRCRQAGMTRTDLDRQLPVGDRLLDDTWGLARTLRFTHSAVADLTVARPGIDADTPADEWAQRMTRVHARLHRHVNHGRVSVRTLHDLARLGLVTSHVLATSGRRNPTQAKVTDQWRAVLADLDPLHSIEPHDRVLRHDVDRLLHLARPASTSGLDQDGLLDAIAASAPTMDACSALAAQALARSTDVWIPAAPRRSYLPDVHAPGHAARRAPPSTAPWPGAIPQPPGPSGLTVD
jgi:hypothetical protein